MPPREGEALIPSLRYPLRSFLPTKRHLELSGAIARPLCPSCTSTIAFAMQLVPWHRKQRRQLEDGSAWSDEHRLRLARRRPFCVRRVAGYTVPVLPVAGD